MDGGAWWAAVHGVAKSRTRLSDFTFTFHFQALEKEMATHSTILAWRIPGMTEPGGLPSMGSHRVGRDWSDLAAALYKAPQLWSFPPPPSRRQWGHPAWLMWSKWRLRFTLCAQTCPQPGVEGSETQLLGLQSLGPLLGHQIPATMSYACLAVPCTLDVQIWPPKPAGTKECFSTT